MKQKIKKPTEFLCQDCLKKMRQYDRERRRIWQKKVKIIGNPYY